MIQQWARDEHIMFDDCVFADDYVADDVRDFLSPANTDNLLLWGQPGTAKSTTIKAIAFERYRTVQLEEHGVLVLNCKDKEQAKRLNSKYLRNRFNFALCNSDCPILILDELDELTEAQQRELTAFIDFSSSGQFRTMVLATTNVNLRDKRAREKAFSAALLSRFNTKLEMRQQPPERFLPLAQKKLAAANVPIEDRALIDVLKKHCDPTSTAIDIRTVQTIVNKLIRKSQQPPIQPPPIQRLRIV